MVEEEEEELDIFIFDTATDKKYLFQVPPNIKSTDLRKKLEIFLEATNFEFRYKSKLYKDDEIISFQEGDTIYIYKKEEAKVSESNTQAQNKGFAYVKLPKILHLILVKYISDNSNNLNNITDKDTKNIISEIKNKLELNKDESNNIKICKKEKIDCDILSYANDIFAKIDEKEINYLIVNEELKIEATNFLSTLSTYQPYQSFFEDDLPKALEKSNFKYSISGIQLLPLTINKNFFEEEKKCQNKTYKYLFHELPLKTKKELNINLLPYSGKALYGIGIYFTDEIDYLAHKTNKKEAKAIPIKSSFSCSVSQIYYDNKLKRDISEPILTKSLDNYLNIEEIKNKFKDKIVVKNGLHFVGIKDGSRQNLIGNEYIIYERDQILPLFVLDLKIKESKK